jgi:hypothetical protein
MSSLTVSGDESSTTSSNAKTSLSFPYHAPPTTVSEQLEAAPVVAMAAVGGMVLVVVILPPGFGCGYCEKLARFTSWLGLRKIGLSETPSVHNATPLESGGQSGGTGIPAKSDSVGKISTNSTYELDRPVCNCPGLFTAPEAARH